MIFQHTWEKVLSGKKTQTRRIVKPGEWLRKDFSQYPKPGVVPDSILFPSIEEIGEQAKQTGTVNISNRYTVGKTYAVQPGRGKPGIWWRQFGDLLQTTYDAEFPPSLLKFSDAYFRLRIRITGIRREDVRNISDEDVRAEGLTQGTRLHFLRLWASMHDTKMLEVEFIEDSVDRYMDRPAQKYDAWVLEFEVVR